MTLGSTDHAGSAFERSTVARGASAEPLTGAERPAGEGAYSRGYNAYITVVLALVFMLAATDRNIMSILLVPIQQELGASDTAMGALTGAAFALVYATTALPLARLADRGNRRNLIAAAVGVWSAMTAVCGVATNYITLLAARMGVAAGEAAHAPSIMSMVGDLYPRQRRGFAIGCIFVGSSLGIALGAYIAGRLSDLYGWRTAFFAMGVPGLLVAALVWLTLPEPRRGAFDGAPPKERARIGFLDSVRYLLSVRTIPRLFVAKLLLSIGFMGFLAWSPAFFMRVHGMTTSEMSALFGASVGFGGVASQLMGGAVSDWLCKRGERWRSYYCALALIGGLPFMLMVVFGPTPAAVVGMFGISVVTGGVTTVSITAGLSIVRSDMRGFMTAAMAFCIQVIGGGLGPVVIGALNDGLKDVFGDESLRYTLIFVPTAWLLAAVAFAVAARTTDRDAEASLLA